MDKFSQLIIEAYRNPNFRFAEEPTTVDPESEINPPPMLDYASLFARLQALDLDRKISVLQNLRRAQTKLKTNYNIDSQLPLKLDPTTSVFSDNSLANTDDKVSTYFYRVYEYLVTYFENVSNPVPESDSTAKTEESSSAVDTAPSTDPGTGETYIGSDTSEESAENIPPITIKVSGGEYRPPELITLSKRINIIGSDSNSSIVLDDESVTKYNCVIQFREGKWILSKEANSALYKNRDFIDGISELNVGDQIVPGTNGVYILSVEKIGTDSGGWNVDESKPISSGFFGDDGEDNSPSFGGFSGFGGRRR